MPELILYPIPNRKFANPEVSYRAIDFEISEYNSDAALISSYSSTTSDENKISLEPNKEDTEFFIVFQQGFLKVYYIIIVG